MNLFKAMALGLLQGLTEFLPVSSSGHLVIAQRLFGITEPPLLFDVILHAGTLLAVLLFFRGEIKGLCLSFGQRLRNPMAAPSPEDRFLGAVFLGTIPTVFIGLLFKDFFEESFASLEMVGLALMGTGLILLLTLRASVTDRPLTGWRALVIGTAQGLAIMPGISRSGTTIATGMLSGLDRVVAARYSFILSIPAILGAVILQLLDGDTNGVGILPMLIGFAAAFGSGYLALGWLMKVVAPGLFHRFGYYCLPVGALVFLIGRYYL